MTDVFNAETETNKVEPVPPKTPEDRLKEKDEFIESLKRQTAELREDLAKRVDAEKALEDLRNELKSMREQSKTASQGGTQASALSEVDIRTLVQKTITDTESLRSKEQNVKTANDELVSHYGGDTKKASEEVQKRAKDLGVSVQFLKDAAAQSPTAFIRLMEIESKGEDSSTFVQSSVNSEGVGKETKRVLKEGTYEYFRDLHKTNPKLYFSPSVQQQIMKSAKAGTYVIPT